MNTKATKNKRPEREARISRSISLYAQQEQKLLAAAGDGDVSGVVRELIDRGLDESGAKKYLDARDKGVQFSEDIEKMLVAAGIQCSRDAKVSGEGSNRTDILATWEGKKVCIELKSSGRPDRLELALGSALVLKSQSKLAAVVCVPYITESGVNRMYASVGVGIATPESVVQVVKDMAERGSGQAAAGRK